MNLKNVYFWSVVVALGGFLFGFDTAVISGAEQSIQKLWSLSDFDHGLAVAIALYGTVIGAMFGGLPADKVGRKQTLFWIGILYLISALGSALATDQYVFMIFRFIGGLGVGASSVVAPMYISEVAPADKRGRLVGLFQFNIVFGILIAYFSNYLISGLADDAWRWMLGVEAVPAIAFVVLVLGVPRSPRWLIVKRGNIEEAREVIARITPDRVEQAIVEIQSSIDIDADQPKGQFFSKKYSWIILLVFLFAFFNQLSGINAIIYYAPRIFNLAGLGSESALLSTTGIGLINLIFTLVGMGLIDKFGRKVLMIVGSLGLIISLGLVSYAFYSQLSGGVPIFIFMYIAFFALSQGAVIWVFIAEVFPNKVRAYGQSFGSFTHWILAAIIANIFPYVVNKYDGGPLFLFFSMMMILQLLYVLFMMPETKGKSLEELEKDLLK